MNDEFLMRRIQYTPNYVKIYCDIPIKMLQEVYFNSIIKLPKIIFGLDKFHKYEIVDNHINVDIVEWSEFQQRIVSLFNGVNEELVKKNIKDNLYNFEKKVNKAFEKKKLSAFQFKTLISLMADVDAFAIFNMYLPTDNYKKELKKINPELNIEDIMVCAFEPHRLQVRKEKLKLVKKYKNQTIKEEDYHNYYYNYIFYEEFEKWLFDTSRFSNKLYLHYEIDKLSKKYSDQELDNEINLIDDNRKNSLRRTLDFVTKCKNINRYRFLSVVVTEEEKRHMIECRLLLLIGLTLDNIDIDISRSSISEIYKSLKGGECFDQR